MGFFTDAVVNAGLDARMPVAPHLSAHTAYSATGLNEVAGGAPAYARAAVGVDAAAARVLDNTDAETLNIPAGTTVRWLGIWSAAVAGTFHGMVPLGATTSIGCVVLDTDTVYAPAHGFAASQKIVFLADDGDVPAGITEGDVYFVLAAGLTTDTFTFSATDGGAAVNVTASDTAIVSDIVEEVFSSQGTLELAAGALDVVGLG